MTAEILVGKTMHNATRCFDKHLGVREAKAAKRLINGIIRKGTTVLQRLYSKEDKIQVNKYREALSNHLGKMNIQPVIDEKAKLLINKTKKYRGYNILAGDASDIFKPHAQCMEALRKVRDGSTGSIGNGYVIYGININGITHQLSIKDPSIEYIGNEKWEKMLKKSALVVDPTETIGVFDRGHDSLGFIDILMQEKYNFVVRGKKSRMLKDLGSGEKKKAGMFIPGKYRVELEGSTEAYLYVVKGVSETPVILYSNIDFDKDQECLEIYLRRRKIEEDYKKLKSFGLEKVRLMSLQKVVNIMLIIQFIVMLGQSLYNEVVTRCLNISGALFLYYKAFCRKRVLTQNPSSFLRFVSENIGSIKDRIVKDTPSNTLFGNAKSMKKVGLI